MATVTTAQHIKAELQESIRTKQRLLADDDLIETIGAVAEACVAAYRRGNRILVAGNGGSAADSQHIAAELVSRFYFDRPGLPAIALTTDTSMLTAIGNDYGFERLFARQVQANGREGDVFIGISTSGKSRNILAGLEEARTHGICTVGFTGATNGPMDALCDFIVHVPSTSTPRIQESHITIGHLICADIEEQLFKSP